MTAPSRRELFRGFLGKPRAPVSQPPPRFGRAQPLPMLRPPGAIEESAFLNACTRCEDCIESCPHEAIVHAPARFRGAAGTPMLNLPDAPCWMCSGYPCISACKTGALRADIPPKMGTALISPLECLAHQNSPCSACVERCPVPDAIAWENSRPTVRPDVCTGCGVCQHVCPAPHNAVLVMPRRERRGA